MLKLVDKKVECNTCDYWYENFMSGCIFPNDAPINSMPQCDCIQGVDCKIEIDEDHVQIQNIEELTIL